MINGDATRLPVGSGLLFGVCALVSEVPKRRGRPSFSLAVQGRQDYTHSG